MSNNKQVKVTKADEAARTEVIIQNSFYMGNKLHDTWEETEDLKVAQMTLAAYSLALKGIQLQIINKKLTGKPAVIQSLKS